MPNHIMNRVKITGPIEKLNEFYNFNKSLAKENNEEEDMELDFNKAIPEPIYNSKSDNTSSDGLLDWYEWRVDNWGTKWNAYDINVNKNEEELYYQFNTAWSHPLEWYKKVFKMFPELDINIVYIDEGFNFFGRATVQNGEYSIDFEYDYSSIPDFLHDQKNIELESVDSMEYYENLVEDYNLSEYDIYADLLYEIMHNDNN